VHWRHQPVVAIILAMETTSLADAKNRLSELVNAVQGTWERVTITKNGRPAAVLIAPEDLETLVETLEILSDPEAMAAIREARTGKGEWTTGEEMAVIMISRLGRDVA
jgi:antitoxin YefM